MSSPRTWMLVSTVMSTAVLLLPTRTAEAQEAFVVGVTQETATVDSQTGMVTVGGTVTCSEPTEAEVFVLVTQPVGRTSAVEGARSAYFFCDADGEPYTLQVFGYNGRFAPGRAVITVDAIACGSVACDGASVQQSVKLQR